MKKLLTIIALASVASLSYGQGFVSWFNTTGTRVSLGGFVPGGTASLVPAYTSASFYYALFVAPSTTTTIGTGVFGDPTQAGWTFTGDYATNTAAGRLLGISSQPDGTGIQIPGYAPGTSASFAIVGWSANLGTTWAQVQAGIDSGFQYIPPASYYGVDQSVATGVALAAYPGPYIGVMGGAPSAGGFVLYELMPEPSPIALTGLGAAALLVFRRRK